MHPRAIILFGLLGLAPAALAAEVPSAQARFIQVNDAVASLLEGANNPTIGSLVSVLDRRSRALCELAPLGAAANWLAIVGQIDLAAHSLQFLVGPAARLSVVNLPVAQDNPFLADIGALKVGDQVQISGTFVAEGDHCFRQVGDLTADALREPEFDFRIGAVIPLAVTDHQQEAAHE